MNNSTNAKKQTRVLVISLSVITVFAALMILLSTLDGQKKQTEQPPVVSDTAVIEDDPERPMVHPENTTAGTGTDDTTASTEPQNTAAVNTFDAIPDFISPLTGAICHGYSTDVPVYSLTMDDYRTHGGVDIVAELGTPIRATADGTVTEVWEDPMMGKCIRIAHAGKAVSIYKNLAPELPLEITTGATVQAGTVIASVGESALIELAEVPHLHYELLIDGVNVNPSDFILIGTVDNTYEG